MYITFEKSEILFQAMEFASAMLMPNPENVNIDFQNMELVIFKKADIAPEEGGFTSREMKTPLPIFADHWVPGKLEKMLDKDYFKSIKTFRYDWFESTYELVVTLHKEDLADIFS